MTLTIKSKFILLLLSVVTANGCASTSKQIGWQLESLPDPTAASPMPEVSTKLVSFETTEGTWMTIDVSPDGKTLVFDLLGDLYLMPITGGEAVPLTTGMSWDQSPRYSPDGNHIYFVSDRVGHNNIWRYALSDESLEKVTAQSGGEHSSLYLGHLNWSIDGEHILISVGTETGDTLVRAVDPTSGKMMTIDEPRGPWLDTETGRRLRSQVSVFSAVGSVGEKLYFAERLGPSTGKTITPGRRQSPSILYEYENSTKRRTPITAERAIYDDFKPQLSRDGGVLAYFRQYQDRRTELRVRDLSTGHDRSVTALANTDDAGYLSRDDSRPNYAFTPDGRAIIFWHDGKIHRVQLANGSRDIIPFRVQIKREVVKRILPTPIKFKGIEEASTIRWPTISPDGRTMVFSAVGFVWVKDIETGVTRRLSASTDFEYMPALSPDGKSVAYISFSNDGVNYGTGRLIVKSLDGAPPRQLLTDPLTNYLLPKWSPDGSKIAVVKETVRTWRHSHVKATYGWTSSQQGVFNEVAAPKITSNSDSISHYGRYVGFDESGEKMLISYPESAGKVLLLAHDLKDNTAQTLAIGTSEVRGIMPSPDLKMLALTRWDRTLWTINFGADDKPVPVSIIDGKAHKVSKNGAFYADWIGSDRLSFGYGNNVYDYSLREDKLQFMDIRVPVSKGQQPRTFAFTGARLITLSDENRAGKIIESGTLVLSGKRIIAVGGANKVQIPLDASIIDVSNKTIIPGLLDTHYHYMLDGQPSAFALPQAGFSDKTAVAYGITSAWEAAGPFNDGASAGADLQRAGRIIGPRWSHAGIGGVGKPYKFASSYDAALMAVDRHGKLGVDVLKEYNAPTRELRQWLGAASAQRGLGIVSHLERFDEMMTRVVDGYTGGDHTAVPAPLFRDVFELLRQTGFIWTPNLSITQSLVGPDRAASEHFWREAFKRFPGERQKLNTVTSYNPASLDPLVSEALAPYGNHRLARVAAAVSEVSKNGGTIGVSAHNMPGVLLHQEMWHLHKGGMPIADVLRATTMTNAEKLGLQEEVGSLEAGKMADFLILDENPLDDILNTLSIKYTIQGGVIYDADTAERVDPMDLPLCTDEIRGQDVCREVTIH